MAVSFYLIHGYFLWAAWTFFGLLQLSTNRYLKHRWEMNMWLHRISGSALLFATLLFGGVGYFKLKFVKDDVHAPMGIAVTLVITFLVVSGVIARSRLNRAEKNQEASLCFKLFHKVSINIFQTNFVSICPGVCLSHADNKPNHHLRWNLLVHAQPQHRDRPILRFNHSVPRPMGHLRNLAQVLPEPAACQIQ